MSDVSDEVGEVSFDEVSDTAEETTEVSFDSVEDVPEKVEADSQDAEVVEDEDEEQPTISDKEVEADLKLMKARMGDAEYDMPEDALFTQKVNGEDTEVTLRDLLNNYSGKVDYTRKYNEFGKEKQGLQKEKYEFDNRINTFVSKASENKLDALAYLAETAGADPVAFIKEFKQGLIPDLESYLNMSEIERDAYDAKQELDIMKKSQTTKASNEEYLQEYEALETEITSQIEDLGIEQSEYVAAYDRLVESGHIASDQIGPDTVAQWIGMENRVNLVDAELAKIDSNLADDVALIEDLVRTSLESGLDEETTIEVIKEMYGQPSKEAQSASKKARQHLRSPANNDTTSYNQNRSDSEDVGPIDFDDI